MTLEQLAESAGLSIGIVSQLERGSGNPSFATLVQIAHGLDEPVGRLMHIDENTSPVVRRADRRHIDGHGLTMGNAEYELLTPNLEGALQATWVRAQPGHDTSEAPFQHNGEEFGVVIRGHLTVFVNGVRHDLDEGDSIRFRPPCPTGSSTTQTTSPSPSGSPPRPPGNRVTGPSPHRDTTGTAVPLTTAAAMVVSGRGTAASRPPLERPTMSSTITTSAPLKLRRRAMLGLGLGNTLEWYDWQVFGLLAATLGPHFFRGDSDVDATLNTLSIFAVGFLARPLGGVLFGGWPTRSAARTSCCSRWAPWPSRPP